MSRLVAFGYSGGKYYQLNWLKTLLPKCHHFVEPFCGSAIVTLNRKPSEVETINDLDGDIVNFFRVLRNDGRQLIELLENTAYARQEFIEALQPTDDPIERARRFYVRAYQKFSSVTIHSGTAGNWGYNIVNKKSNYVATKFINVTNRLYALRNRLKLIQIENKPALDIIKRYDHSATLFYCDPPYMSATHDGGGYGKLEMSDDDHRELATALHRCKANIAISGHRCDLYDELYTDWTRHDKDFNRYINAIGRSTSSRRVESLWTNYEVGANA